MENPSPNKKYWDSFLKILPLVQWILTLVIGIAVFGLGFRDTQTSAAQNIRDVAKDQDALRRQMDDRKSERDKQIDDLRKTVITREVFDERTNTILKQIEQLRQENKENRDYFERALQK